MARPTIAQGCGGDASAVAIASVTVTGTLVADGGDAPREGSAIAVIWDLVDPSVEGFGPKLGPWVPVSGVPPIDFALEIEAAPAPELLIQLADANAIAVARFYLIPAPEGGLSDTILVTGSVRQLLVYVERQVGASSPAARFLHGTMGAGYHLVDVHRPDPFPDDCSETVIADERGFPRYSGDCPRDTLSLAPDDLLTSLDARFERKNIRYENLETAW